MRIQLSEHLDCTILKGDEVSPRSMFHFSDEVFSAINIDKQRYFKIERRKKVYPYNITKKDDATFLLQADYYVGLDWLVEGKKYISVEPKVNAKLFEIYKNSLNSDEELQDEEKDSLDTLHENEIINATLNPAISPKVNYIKMLLVIYAGSVPEMHIGDLVKIYWDSSPIKIEQREDQLTPFLVVQFLNLLKSIVRKGLKESYYKVQENLTNKVKGKILVGRHIKQNVFKNRLTKALCEYQVFGEDNPENKFLKKVFQFVLSYVQNNELFFKDTKLEIENIINYCRPAFELINDDLKDIKLHDFKYNPFFKEYKEAVKIGNYILKQFAYNISATSATEIESPPFWIDMPRLFELYVYQKMLEANNFDTNKILYQFSTYGNYLDFLIKDGGNSMVIDTKYKLHYKLGHIHEDIRQVSGYARLKQVRKKLNINDDRNINCLIIYPTLDEQECSFQLDEIVESFNKESNQIKAYHKVYKLGITLPTLI